MGEIISLFNILFLNIMNNVNSKVFLIVIIILLIQYKNIGKLEKQILGINKKSTLSRVATSMTLGILGGIIGSIIILSLGVTIEKSDFTYILILSVVLMMIHPRFVCLSYSGGLVSLLSIAGFTKVNVPNLMAVVAILHLVESFLILIDGASAKIPIFIERDNKVIGGFSMTKYWGVPFIILVATSTMDNSINTVSMPTWWPLLSIDIIGNNITYFMTGIIAILGYGDIAVTQYPEEKAKESAKSLVLFSISLLTLSIIANKIHSLEIIVALYAPIAHEVVIYMSRLKERKGVPVFSPVKEGVRILDIMPKSIGEAIKLKPGNIIKSINGKNIYNQKDITYALLSEPKIITIVYKDNNGRIMKKTYKGYKREKDGLGLLVINQYSSVVMDLKEEVSIIQNIYRKIKGLLLS